MAPVIALIFVQLIFGFNYAASKIILSYFPPLLWCAIRIAIAAVFMFILGFALVPRDSRKASGKFLYPVFLFAVFGIVLNQVFFLYGLKYTTTSNSAILNTLTPIFTLLIAILLKHEKWTIYRGTGFLVAVAGVLVLRSVENFQISLDTLKGDLFTILNCASLAFYLVISKDFVRRNSPIWVTAWMFLFAAVMLSILAIPDFTHFEFTALSQPLKLAIAYNIIGATMITYFLNSWTLSKVTSSQVAIFIYLQPVVAVLNAWYMFGEVPTLRTVIAMGCIFTGVGLGLIKKA